MNLEIVDHDITVEEFIIKVLQKTQILLTALPFLTLVKSDTRKTFRFQNKIFLKPEYGLPFFENLKVASENCRKFYLRINVMFLPEFELSQQALGQRGIAMVIHQVLTDLRTSPQTCKLAGVSVDENSFQSRRQAVLAGIAYLSSVKQEPERMEQMVKQDGTERRDEENGALLNKESEHSNRQTYCRAFHKHVYGSMDLFRRIIGKQRSFVEGMLASLDYYTNSNNIVQFWNEMTNLNNETHPLVAISDIWVSN